MDTRNVIIEFERAIETATRQLSVVEGLTRDLPDENRWDELTVEDRAKELARWPSLREHQSLLEASLSHAFHLFSKLPIDASNHGVEKMRERLMLLSQLRASATLVEQAFAQFDLCLLKKVDARVANQYRLGQRP